MKKFIFVSYVIIPVIFLSSIVELTADFYPKERTIFIEQRISFKKYPKHIKDLRIWIPYPVSDNWQAISDFKLVSSFDIKYFTDREYGNRIAYLTAVNRGESFTQQGGKSIHNTVRESIPEIIITFTVKRKEYTMPDHSSFSEEYIAHFLKPNRRVPVNKRLRALAEKITQEKNNDLEKVRSIYDYVIDELNYSNDDPRICGIGDSLLTLKHKKGICTDYHSLFISLVRSIGIPAKFEIGFPIPVDKEEGKINGYHCWAKFYLKGKGWMPVDISEADKHPEKREYFFGNIDENRIHLTTGRDIHLDNTHAPRPLNFFVYPYIELNGSQFTDIDIELSFKDLRGGG